MTKKKIKRENASILRPKKLKKIDIDKFVDLSKKLRRAVDKEEATYGPLNDHSSLA